MAAGQVWRRANCHGSARPFHATMGSAPSITNGGLGLALAQTARCGWFWRNPGSRSMRRGLRRAEAAVRGRRPCGVRPLPSSAVRNAPMPVLQASARTPGARDKSLFSNAPSASAGAERACAQHPLFASLPQPSFHAMEGCYSQRGPGAGLPAARWLRPRRPRPAWCPRRSWHSRQPAAHGRRSSGSPSCSASRRSSGRPRLRNAR